MTRPFLRTAAVHLPAWLLLAASAGACAQATTFAYRGAPLEIGPNINNVANLRLYVDGLGTITDLDVRFDALPGCSATEGDNAAAIEHTRVGELVITLISPNNTELVLVDNRGGFRSNICDTLLDDDGGHPTLGTLTSVAGQSVAGSYRPDNALSIFDGESPNGFWTLRVEDQAAGPSNVGTANRYSLLLQSAAVPEIVVDQLDDPAPDGCTPGACSLREALSMANARPGLDRIVLPAGTLQITRPGVGESLNQTGDLDVLEGVEIIGAGAAATTLQQTIGDRLLHAESGRDLTLRHLRLQGGNGVTSGGAVFATGKLVIEDAAFSDNTATRQGGAVHHRGGGLNDAARPQVTVLRTVFEDNETDTAGDFEPALGGALYTRCVQNTATCSVRVEASDFHRNRSVQGGGALAFDNEGGLQPFSRLVVLDSQFLDNQVLGTGDGGAIGVNFGGGGSTDTRIERSLFLRNSVSSLGPQNTGGALYVSDGSVGTTTALVRDSTFCDNLAQAAGGAIFLQDQAGIAGSTFCDNAVRTADTAAMGGGAVALDYGRLEVARSTFEGNDAMRGGAITVEEGDFYLRSTTMVATGVRPIGVLGTLLRLNHETANINLHASNNILLGTCSFRDADTVFANARNNIEDANTCRFTSAPINADNQLNVTPGAVALQRLGDYGGPTETRLPASGSIAIDTANTSLCSRLDQRGYAATNRRCDIGAVEAEGAPLPALVFGDGFED